MFGVREVRDKLRPYVALSAENMLRLPRCQFGSDGLEGIDFLYRQVAADAERLLAVVIALIIIKIPLGSGSQDGVVALFGSLRRGFRTAP